MKTLETVKDLSDSSDDEQPSPSKRSVRLRSAISIITTCRMGLETYIILLKELS